MRIAIAGLVPPFALVALVLVGGWTLRIARPLPKGARAARRVAGGHYAERVPADEPGELGELAARLGDLEAWGRSSSTKCCSGTRAATSRCRSLGGASGRRIPDDLERRGTLRRNAEARR